MKPSIQVYLPFDGCGKCKNIELETQKLYTETFYGDEVPYVINHFCVHEDICRNAYNIWNGKEKTNEK